MSAPTWVRDAVRALPREWAEWWLERCGIMEDAGERDVEVRALTFTRVAMRAAAEREAA